MTARAIAKRKRRQLQVTCPDCMGMRESVVVMGANRHGEPMPGIINRNVECETCLSTGKVDRARKAVCCCSLPPDVRCRACAEAYGLIHVCTVPTDEEMDIEATRALSPPLLREHKALSHETMLRLAELS